MLGTTSPFRDHSSGRVPKIITVKNPYGEKSYGEIQLVLKVVHTVLSLRTARTGIGWSNPCVILRSRPLLPT